MNLIPAIAGGAGKLRKTHAEISAGLSGHMAQVCESQKHALSVLNDAVVAGRTRTDKIVHQSYDIMSHLQFQDRIAQDLNALINQELASGELIERSVRGLD